MSDFSFPPKYFPQILAVKVVIEHDGKFLIMREGLQASWKPGRLGLPGGKIDPGEDWATALERELQEELGVEAEPVGMICIEEIVYHNPKLDLDQLTNHFLFQAKISDETFSELSKKENVQWHTLEELKQIHVDEMTEFYFTSLWEHMSQPTFQLVPLDFIHVNDGIKNEAFRKWYSKS